MGNGGEPWSAGLEGLAPPKRPGFPVDPRRVRRALWDGRIWLAGAAIVGLAVGFIYVKFLIGDTYETTVTLRHEGDITFDHRGRDGIAIGPAADALMRESVLREIRDQLGFDSSLRSMAEWIAYETEPRAGTMYFTVSGETGEDAAEYAEVVTEVFMAYHRERQSRGIEAKIARTVKRIQAAEEEAEEARELYNAFRETHGIADLSTEQESMVESAAEYRAQGELAVSEIRALEAQLASLQAQLARVPKTNVVGGGTSPERATYDRLRQELASARATLSPAHPRVQALEQQVNQLRSQLRAGGNVGSMGGGLIGVNATYQTLEAQVREDESELAALRERKKGLDEMADKSRARVQAFSEIEGEGSALLAEVKVNEALVAKLQSTEAALEDALGHPPSGFVILDPGAAPEFPVDDKMKLVVFLAIPALALLATLLVVLRREFHGLWVRTPAEVAFWGNGPVLAASSWPDETQGLDELVAGLDDFMPLARGSLLVIGGSPDEFRLAGEFARQLHGDWFVAEAPAAKASAAPSPPVERGPLQTPPPSGPYPIGGSSGSVALARLPSAPPSDAIRLAGRADLIVEAWDGPQDGQGLRRAARIADRVIVVVRSGTMSAIELHGVRNRIGRHKGVGFIVAGLAGEFGGLPDRVGDVSGFWRS